MQTVQIEPILQFNPKSSGPMKPSSTQHFFLQGDLANILALQNNNLKSGFTTHRPIVSSGVNIPWTSSRILQGIASRYGYDAGLLQHGISLPARCGDGYYPPLDVALLAGVRRKNATRETTNALKTWLNEHRKNPYPTKGEKIMLAILTKMTLTQVSTWFANARRRLKKENKMTWSPKNKTGDVKPRRDNNSISTDDQDDSDIAADDDDGDDDYDMSDDDDRAFYQQVSEQHSLAHVKSSPAPVPNAPRRTTSDARPADDLKPRQEPRHQQHVASRREEEPASRRSPIVTVQLEAKSCCTTKDRYASGDSPVTSLRRWVDDCFGEKAPPPPSMTDTTCSSASVITPPQTPVEKRLVSMDGYDDVMSSSRQEGQVHAIARHCPVAVPVITSPIKRDLPSSHDAVSKALEPRSFALTTNREMDAVLALTTLCSR